MFNQEREDKLLNLIQNGFIPFTHAQNVEIIFNYVKGKNSTDDSQMADGRDLIVVVGPSGSGKTTIIANLYEAGLLTDAEGKFIPFVNRFYNNEKMTLQEEIAYKAALLEKGKSFMLEAAQFDANYREFIKIAKLKYGYNICMLYLTKSNPQENISMVEKRRREGGHGRKNVELDASVLQEMYEVDSQNLVEILPYCDMCYVVKNQTMSADSAEKPVVLLQKKLSGEIVYDTRYEHAEFLHDQILGIKTPKPAPRLTRPTGRFIISPRQQAPKVIIKGSVPRQTLLPQVQIKGRNQQLRVLTGIKRRISEISSISIEGELDRYTPEQIERIISGYGPGMGGKKK